MTRPPSPVFKTPFIIRPPESDRRRTSPKGPAERLLVRRDFPPPSIESEGTLLTIRRKFYTTFPKNARKSFLPEQKMINILKGLKHNSFSENRLKKTKVLEILFCETKGNTSEPSRCGVKRPRAISVIKGKVFTSPQSRSFQPPLAAKRRMP